MSKAILADVEALPRRRGGLLLLSLRGLALIAVLLVAEGLLVVAVLRYLQPEVPVTPGYVEFPEVKASVPDIAGRQSHEYVLQPVLRVPQQDQEALSKTITTQLSPLFVDRLQVLLSRVPTPRERQISQQELRRQLKREVRQLFEQGLRSKVPAYKDRKDLILEVEFIVFDL